MSKPEISPSKVSLQTFNPIRQIVDSLKITPNPLKNMISLGLGDPTLFGNLKIHEKSVDEIINNLKSYKYNGYAPSVGDLQARKAIASYYGNYEYEQVFIASGCSDALNLAISVLVNEGDNILIPRPGFSLYETLAGSKGIHVRYYDLLPEKQWEMDLFQLENLIDQNTKAIVLNNPSNPCGSNYGKQHLEGITSENSIYDIISKIDYQLLTSGLLDIADRHNLPIIADEIYADMVFEGETFYPLAKLSKKVPILTCGGLAKRFLVPGWRVGWVLVHDPLSVMGKIKVGLTSLSQLIIGANTLIQSAIPQILSTPEQFHKHNMNQLYENAMVCVKGLEGAKGIKVVVPKGAMYLMVEIEIEKFKGIKSDSEFVEQLVSEESVLCLPGSCFKCPKPFVRIVFSSPKDVLREAMERIKAFCDRRTS